MTFNESRARLRVRVSFNVVTFQPTVPHIMENSLMNFPLKYIKGCPRFLLALFVKKRKPL